MTSQITGFDIGEKTLKMVHFSKGELKKAVSEELPDNLVSEGRILSMDAMADFITSVAKKHSIPRREAAIVLPTQVVFVRTVTVPVMSEKQLDYNLPYEFKDYLSEEKNKYYFDYEVLETLCDENGKPKEQRLFACAAAKDTVSRYQAMFSRAGYHLKVAVPEEYAYARLCRGDISDNGLKDKAVALIDLSQRSTAIHLLRNGEYDTKRVIDIGSVDIEHVIAEIFETDEHTAHNYKRSNHENVLSHPRCMELYNRLAVEILKAVNFYNYNNRDVELADLYLFGGGASVTPLVDTIRQVTDLHIHAPEELMKLDGKSGNPWMYLRAACGAAKE